MSDASEHHQDQDLRQERTCGPKHLTLGFIRAATFCPSSPAIIMHFGSLCPTLPPRRPDSIPFETNSVSSDLSFGDKGPHSQTSGRTGCHLFARKMGENESDEENKQKKRRITFPAKHMFSLFAPSFRLVSFSLLCNPFVTMCLSLSFA